MRRSWWISVGAVNSSSEKTKPALVSLVLRPTCERALASRTGQISVEGNFPGSSFLVVLQLFLTN